MTQPNPPRDAATVILMRDTDAGPPEIYLVKRNAAASFMGGAYVFPGGRLDDEDFLPEMRERAFGLDGSLAASILGEADPARALGLYIAALRETFEEAGVLLACEEDGRPLETASPRIERLLEEGRARLLARETSFLALLKEFQVKLDVGALTYLARWVTPEVEPKRFDARFFIGHAPKDQRAVHDQAETTDGVWRSAEDVLARHKEGEIFLAPPTFRTLENLLPFQRAEEAIEAAKKTPAPVVRPCMLFGEDSEVILLLDHDPEHPSPGPGPFLPGPSRIVLKEGRWWSRS